MNNAQIANLITTVLQALLGGLVTKGLLSSSEVESVGGALGVLVVFALTHNWHATGVQASGPNNGANTTNKTNVVLAFALAGALVLGVAAGCSTTPQQATYQAAATTEVTVEQALQAYDAWAKAGKTSVAQNQAVAAAYAKYQAAMAVVCDAGSVYAAAAENTSTNTPSYSVALQQAVINANQSLADLEALIVSFGVKL